MDLNGQNLILNILDFMRFFIYLSCLVVLAIIVLLLAGKSHSGQDASASGGNKKTAEYCRYMAAVETMSYQELEKIHEDLVELSLYTIAPGLLFYAEEETGKPGFSPEKVWEETERRRAEKLPPEKRLYGCVTYGDAEELNQIIVKKLDEWEG